VKNYGPINGSFKMNADTRLTLIVGTQGTGKSTVAKLAHFLELSQYKLLRRFAQENPKSTHKDKEKFLDLKFKNWMHFNVTDDTEIIYENAFGTTTVNKSGYKFNLINGYLERVENNSKDSYLLPSLYAHSRCVYIPACRAFFTNISKDSRYHTESSISFTAHYLKYRDNIVREKISSTLEHALESKVASNPSWGIKNKRIGKRIIDLFYKIIHGSSYKCCSRCATYTEHIEVKKGPVLPLLESSSGQQAVMPLLVALFNIFLEGKRYLVNIEEPEAHLFPETQVTLMRYIALVANTTDSRILITTHSPYILQSTNLLTFSAKIEKNNDYGKANVVACDERVPARNVNAFLFYRNKSGGFKSKSIINKEQGLINTLEIDTISNVTDSKFMRLMNINNKK